VVLVGFLALIPTLTGPVAAESPDPSAKSDVAMSAVERALAEQIAADHNAARAQAGLPLLHELGDLGPYAAANGERMRSNGTLGHSEIIVLLDDFPLNMWAAENALVMFNPASDAVPLWLESAPHAKNMMAPRATHVWVDVRCAADGRMWVTGQYVERTVEPTDPIPGADPTLRVAVTPDLRCPVPVKPFPTAELFVAQQYRDFLGREADPAGLAYWTDSLNSRRLTPAQVIVNFLHSEEFALHIRPQAEAALTGSPELPTAEEVEAWLSSPGFAAAVRPDGASLGSQVDVLMIYVGMLDRSPDHPGFEYWTDLADRGVGLPVLINGFLHSQEYTSRIA
jgi:hypothetical protein